MGFIASIFCGSSEKNLNNSNNNSNNINNNNNSSSSRTHRPTPTSSNRALHSSSSSSSPVTKTTKEQKLKTGSRANSPSLSPKTSAKTHISGGNSINGSPAKTKGTLKNSVLMNGNNEKVLRVMKTDTNSSYSSTNGTRDSSVHTKDDLAQQKNEKEITIVTQQVGDGEDEDENEMDEKTNVVVEEKQGETGEQYREVNRDAAEKQVLAHTPQIQVSEHNAYEAAAAAAAPHIINQTSSVEVHETQSDSEASSQPSSPHVDAVRMSSQANADIPPIMEANVIDLTKLQKGQAHAKGYKTLLAPKDETRFFNKKCLILDLDETLVHSSFKYVRNADFVIPVDIDNQIHNVYVIKRPGVDKFLEEVSKIYEVVVFTASVSRYGDPLLNILDNITNPAQSKQNTIHHRLYRDSCYTYEGNYVKNLSQIGRPLEDIIILDNSPASYIFHPQHAVPVSSWFSDTHDNELIDILPILADLSGVPDVSKILDVSL